MLHSVLDIPKNDERPIRLLHPSFRDFLLTPSRSGSQQFFIEEEDAHSRLFKKCMNIIMASLKRNICSMVSPGSSPKEIETNTLKQNIPKHVQYACRHWLRHLKDSGDHSDGISEPRSGILSQFLKRGFLYWLEAMSLLGLMVEAVLMISTAAKMAKVRV